MQVQARVDRRSLFISLAAMVFLAAILLALMIYLPTILSRTEAGVGGATSLLADNPELNVAHSYKAAGSQGSAALSEAPEWERAAAARKAHGVAVSLPSDNPELSAAHGYGIRFAAWELSDNPELNASRRYGRGATAGAALPAAGSPAAVSDNPELSASRLHGSRFATMELSDNPELSAARGYASTGEAPTLLPATGGALDEACQAGMGDSILCERNR